MKVMITGAAGQVGKCLLQTAPAHCSIDARTRAQLDLADSASLRAAVVGSHPNVVINAAAYTAVDRAESESTRAYAVNATAVGVLAECCSEVGAQLLHLSTDYVFDGRAESAYETHAQTNPINVYGASKLAGEQKLQAVPNLDGRIVRTSWVYAPEGRNFVLTMLKLFRERGQVSVVSDQRGAPTSALNLARFLWRVVAAPPVLRILHYTDAGIASWYEFAVAINEDAVAEGILKNPAAVTAIATADFPTPAQRPRMSVLATGSSLDCVPFTQPSWRSALREVIAAIGSTRP